MIRHFGFIDDSGFLQQVGLQRDRQIRLGLVWTETTQKELKLQSFLHRLL